MSEVSWRLYSDTLKREVCIAPAHLPTIRLSSIHALELPISGPGTDPRELCLQTIANFSQEAEQHKRHATAELRDEENHVLARAECVRLVRAIKELVHIYDNKLHQREWPKAEAR